MPPQAIHCNYTRINLQKHNYVDGMHLKGLGIISMVGICIALK